MMNLYPRLAIGCRLITGRSTSPTVRLPTARPLLFIKLFPAFDHNLMRKNATVINRMVEEISRCHKNKHMNKQTQ